MSGYTFLQCLASVVSPTLLTASGAFISYMKWFDSHFITQILKATLDFMLPIYVIFSLPKVYSREELWQVWPLFISPLVIVPFLYLLGKICVHLCVVPVTMRTSLTSIYSFASVGVIGILMLKSSCEPYGPLAGEKHCKLGIGYICMMWLPFNLIMYLMILPGLRKDSQQEGEPFFPVFLQYFMVPVPVATMFANILGMIPGTNWFLFDEDSIGFMFTDSAMLIGYCGIMFSQIIVGGSITINLKDQGKLEKWKIILIVISRNIIVPGICLLFVLTMWKNGLFYDDKVMAFTVFIGLAAQPAFLLMNLAESFGLEIQDAKKIILWVYITSPLTLVFSSYIFFLSITD